MKLLASIFICFFVFYYTSNGQNTNSFESDILKIKKINDNIFQHISFIETDNFGRVACNGMIYINEDEAIVFDTPIDDKTSIELINWITKTQNKKIKAVVITHFHNDCLGGLNQFHINNIPSYASDLTIELAKKNNYSIPKNGFKDKIEIKIGTESTFVKYFGEGHTSDNVVGFIPKEKALFGGCLIKTMGAKKGYLGDANISEWSKTVEAIKKQYPDLKIVIPGHGKSGGSELLSYTIKLFQK